jgi:hypothetical protein
MAEAYIFFCAIRKAGLSQIRNIATQDAIYTKERAIVFALL